MSTRNEKELREKEGEGTRTVLQEIAKKSGETGRNITR
ncbi:hypothetical protein B4168_3643 [Anoxybacillus flavithermus]|nr:hypothetical protein B4168_3643 [Anoxybacillus flavithermus]OAO87179.1 hypothetical protein GT23_1362 [Parageobacillus thermoglucosidasius]